MGEGPGEGAAAPWPVGWGGVAVIVFWGGIPTCWGGGAPDGGCNGEGVDII